MRYYFTLTRLAKIKNSDHTKNWQNYVAMKILRKQLVEGKLLQVL